MRYGLIGETLKHSYSARLHALLGDESYTLTPVARGALDAFLTQRDFEGLNVTIPYKRDVLPYCAQLGETAQQIGSVNTLVKRADGTLFGDNTDAYGFAKMAEIAGIQFEGRKTLVLGSGGTSLTACYVIRKAGGEAVVISRNGENGYDQLQKHADAAVLVNATPVGMYPAVDGVPLDIARLPALEGVLDVIYNPLRTKLIQQAEARGCKCAGGLTMLVWQAVRARELFTGEPVPPETALAAQRALTREVSNLVLIGMPGSGKSTVGKRCAHTLHLPFVDTDSLIEARAGKPIPRVFAEDGEAAFRKIETEVLAEVGSHGGQVIATGGGAVLREENRQYLRMNGTVIRLLRPLGKLSTGGRPLSAGADALRRMERDRGPCYRACADRTVQNDRALPDCVRQVLEAYHEALGD